MQGPKEILTKERETKFAIHKWSKVADLFQLLLFGRTSQEISALCHASFSVDACSKRHRCCGLQTGI
jgi:hypothetical protein